MQFDINICDTHVPHWRKQCESEKRKHPFFLHSIVEFSLASIVFTFYFCIIFCWFIFYRCFLSMGRASIFNFCYWFQTFTETFLCRWPKRFYCIKINRKVHYDFPRVQCAKHTGQLPRKNDVFCINNLLQLRSPKMHLCSIQLQSHPFRLILLSDSRATSKILYRFSEVFELFCIWMFCSKFIPFNGHKQNVSEYFFSRYSYCARNVLCAEPINDKRLQFQSDPNKREIHYVTTFKLNPFHSIPLLTCAICTCLCVFGCTFFIALSASCIVTRNRDVELKPKR